MAINTQSELVSHLKFLSGQDNLATADAVTLLNFALDSYSYIALTTDGKWQFDDTSNTDLPRASTTLAADANKVELSTGHLMIRFVEIDNGTTKWKLEPTDLRYAENTTPVTDKTARPKTYDYESGYLYFDTYADQSYTVTVHFSRSANHLTADNTSQVVGIPSIHTEYLILHAMHRLGLRTGDENRVQVRNEMVDMEANIRDFYRRRDEDTDSRLVGNMNIVR